MGHIKPVKAYHGLFDFYLVFVNPAQKMVHNVDFKGFLGDIHFTAHVDVFLTQDILPLLWGGTAHESYWHSQIVAKTIAPTIAL
ncbi:MAG: hypothetical protein LVS60_15765 [Nodosilinea sp. LVE1205-7]